MKTNILLSLAAIFVLSSCEPEYFIELTPSGDVYFDYKPSSTTLMVTSNAKWEIPESSNSYWCEVSPLSGDKGESITITVTTNTLQTERTHIIDVQCEDESITIHVCQGGASYIPTSGKWVDLGLSVMWAGWNVGATKPEEIGEYYAWGETQTKKIFDEHNYLHKEYISNGDGSYYTRYFNLGDNICGSEYDVATIKWKDGARMPTHEEIRELCKKCEWRGVEIDGMTGNLVFGPSGNSIFLPASGYIEEEMMRHLGEEGQYWSGTNFYDNIGEADYMYCRKNPINNEGSWIPGDIGGGYLSRVQGRTVRPVK